MAVFPVGPAMYVQAAAEPMQLALMVILQNHFMFDCYLMQHLVELGVYVYSELKRELQKGSRLQCAATAVK